MSECVLATKVNSNGYGTKTAENHRYVWIAAHGPVPPGFDIGHTCHDADLDCPGGKKCRHRGCYNLEHLALQTRSENLRASRIASPAQRKQRSEAMKRRWEQLPIADKKRHAEQGRRNARKRWDNNR